MTKYYPINEAQARTARTMNSFTEYESGSETAAYVAKVDEVYAIADAKAESMPEYAEEAYSLADRFARKYAEWLNKGYRIEAMCPSVMISGGGNFPVAKKRKQNDARDSHWKQYEPIMDIKRKIAKLGTGGIKSGDPKALEKLEAKLSKLEERQDLMKRANSYWRKNKTLAGMDGISDEERDDIEEYMGRLGFSQPFAPFELNNNRAKIKSTRERIERLKAEKETPSEERETTVNGEECRVLENSGAMRLQLFFDEKPAFETRDILKANGFRWSPRYKAWQRQLTDNARRALAAIEDREG